MSIAVSIDLEQDLPPYGSTFRGIEEGLPKILAKLIKYDVNPTFFVTSDVAKRFPDEIENLIEHGFEIGCHSHYHKKSTNPNEIEEATYILMDFCDVIGYRAPYLRLNSNTYEYLHRLNYIYSSSTIGTHIRKVNGIIEVPITPTKLFGLKLPACTSTLRLGGKRIIPRILEREDIVFYTHPWEYIRLNHVRPRILGFRCGPWIEKIFDEFLKKAREIDDFKNLSYLAKYNAKRNQK